MKNFYLGGAIWNHRGWLGGLYPTGTRQHDYLTVYAQRMTAVEGNTTFYAVPPESTLAKWRGATPEDFHFCPKLPKLLSHEGALTPRIDDSLSFAQHMLDGLGPERLGPFLIQLPPSYGPERGPDLARLLNAWRRRHPGLPVAVEVRHPAWYKPDWAARLNTMLTGLGMARVMLDTRPVYGGLDDPQAHSQRKKPRLPLQPAVTADFTFVRYISHPDRDRNTEFLEPWADQIAEWISEGTRVYFFAHCPNEDRSPAIARWLQQLLEDRGAPIPPLPWNGFDDTPAQRTLF